MTLVLWLTEIYESDNIFLNKKYKTAWSVKVLFPAQLTFLHSGCFTIPTDYKTLKRFSFFPAMGLHCLLELKDLGKEITSQTMECLR